MGAVEVSEPIPASVEQTVTRFLDAAFSVHRELGPGLLESVYEACICHELTLADVPFQRQVSVPVSYRGIQIESGLRLDLLVAGEVVVELKSIDALIPIHEAQLLTYLKITKKRVGILINFNVPLLKQGIKRIVL